MKLYRDGVMDIKGVKLWSAADGIDVKAFSAYTNIRSQSKSATTQA